ncbi:hypothetical protein P692DRAFT_20903091, partial [Suillus brevipes Sb2]
IQSIPHETVCLQNSIFTHKADNVCRCCENREHARDLDGYSKSLINESNIQSPAINACLVGS